MFVDFSNLFLKLKFLDCEGPSQDWIIFYKKDGDRDAELWSIIAVEEAKAGLPGRGSQDKDQTQL